MSRWRISVLGNCSVKSTTKRRIKLSQNVWALVTFLLVAPGRAATRARIAAALWPELDEIAARHCLATTLWRARAAFKPDNSPFFVEDEEITLLLESKFWVDSIAFDRRIRPLMDGAEPLAKSAIRRSVDSYGGDFAANLDADWALIERERLRALHLDALFLLASSYGRAANWPATVAIARRLCAAEPLREDAQRLLMIALEKTGNRGLALKQYEQCRSVLAKELSVEPMQQTRELYRQLAGISAQEPEQSRPPSADLRSAMFSAKRSVGEALFVLENALEHS